MDSNNRSAHKQDFSANLKQDVLASIVVFLVALPLCMGIAIASGVPTDKAAAVGIITGIVGGILVGFIAGCPLQVSGPAAGLAVIVGQLIQEHGFERLGLIVMIAGGIQLIAGLLRAGQWFRAVSPSVIQGMLAGIGILILAAQFHVMVDDKPPGTGKEFGGIMNLATLPQAVWKGLSETDHRPAAILGVITILAIILWTAFVPKKLKFLPAPLFGVVVGTAAAAIFQADANFISVPNNLLEAMQLPTLVDLGGAFAGPSLIENVGPILLAGLALAFVASAESLLTATAVDSMQQHAPRTKYDRELMAQGAGNLLCGLVGALPMTGVIVRSSANVLAGARTRTSTILHGVWLLVFAVLLPQVLRLIPIASLAAVLVFTGYKLMNPAAIRKLLVYGKGEVAIYWATLVTVVVVDLLTGIVVGIGLAFGKLLYTFSHFIVRLENDPQRTRSVLHLEGAATFVGLPKLASVLEHVPPNTELHVYFDELSYIDHACLDLLMNWKKQHEATGGGLVIDWETLTGRFQQYGKPLPKSQEMKPIVPIKTILHPTDFSDHSNFAFQQACSMAREHQARLIVLHVGPSAVATSVIEAAMLPSEAKKALLREELGRLQPQDPNVRVEHRFEEGEAAEEILRAARESHCDLIVMGTHGRSGLSRLLMGSVAEEVVRAAPCSVVTIKGPWSDQSS